MHSEIEFLKARIVKERQWKGLGFAIEIQNYCVLLIYWCTMINERDIVKNIIDFGFLIKSQLHSEDTAMLRSIISIMIMECEDLVEILDERVDPGCHAVVNRIEN